MDLAGSGAHNEASNEQPSQTHQPPQQTLPPPSQMSPLPVLPLQSSFVHAPLLHESSATKLKLLSSSGNGGAPKQVVTVSEQQQTAADQAREILRAAVGAAGAEVQTKTAMKKGTVRYRECMKNHAANIGGHALDGCGEFMPGGEDGSPDALRCAACACHRNFHRREVEGEPAPCECRRTGKPSPAVALAAAGGAILPVPTTTTATPTTLALPSIAHHQQQLPSSGASPLATMPLMSSGPADSDDQDGGISGGGGVGGMRSPSAIRKRFRTKFSTEQKEKMCAFADQLGWRFQKHDEAAVQEFCATVGVKRHVLKVWMHNNKHTLGKKVTSSPS